jgi:hypothetical protein
MKNVSGYIKHAVMKIIIFFLISFTFLTSCSQQKSNYFIPKEFEYPDDSIADGKTFVYRDSINNKYKYEDLRLLNNGSKKLRSILSYTNEYKTDSQIYFNGNLIESYNQLSTVEPKMYKGEIIGDIIINKSGVKEKHDLQLYRNNVVSLKRYLIETYVKDTSILWMGNYLNCYMTKGEARLERSSSYASLNYDQKAVIYFFLAKQIGLIKYSIEYTDNKKEFHNIVWTLSAIENISNNKKYLKTSN